MLSITLNIHLIITLAALLPGAGHGPTTAIVNSPAISTAQLSAADSVTCCYTLSFNYDPADGFYNGVEVSLVPPEASFSAIHFNLAGGWLHTIPVPGRRLRWNRPSGALPTGGYELFDFCIDEWQSNEPIRMAVNWLDNNAVVGTDTLSFACWNCAGIEADSVSCQPDSSLLYTFQFTNLTGFIVHRLRIREAPGNDFIAEEFIPLNPPLQPGQNIGNVTLHLSAALNGASEYCFELTPSRLLNGSIALDCCTVSHCVDIPECDRCCTDYEDFVAEVNQGFSVDFNCEADAVTFFAEQLNDCDEVFWRVRSINGGPTVGGVLEGDIPFTYTFNSNGAYRVCMRVTRKDLDGAACYAPDLATIELCDTIVFDCPCVDSTQINWDHECPTTVNLVCGCDSMTYINSCAAINWAGLELWAPGACTFPMPPLDTITLTATNGPGGGAQLDWTTGGQVTYRYFLIRRKTPVSNYISVGLTQGNVLTYLDPSPQQGIFYQYQIIGVTEPGKPVFSNEDDYVVVSTNQVNRSNLIAPWPNPASDIAYMQFSESVSGELQVAGISGNLVTSKWIHNEQTITLSASEWPPGVYILLFRSAQGEHWAGRLLKI